METPELIQQMNEVIARRDRGVETEEDSAFIKRFLDVFPPDTTREGGIVSFAYPTEAAEWDDEKRRGQRVDELTRDYATGYDEARPGQWFRTTLGDSYIEAKAPSLSPNWKWSFTLRRDGEQRSYVLDV